VSKHEKTRKKREKPAKQQQTMEHLSFVKSRRLHQLPFQVLFLFVFCFLGFFGFVFVCFAVSGPMLGPPDLSVRISSITITQELPLFDSLIIFSTGCLTNVHCSSSNYTAGNLAYTPGSLLSLSLFSLCHN